MFKIILLGTVPILLFPILRWSYRCAYYINKNQRNTDFDFPRYAQYKTFHQRIADGIQEVLDTPHEQVTIQSRDGLKLAGRFYQGLEGRPLIILMHGYRSTAARDCAGAFRIAHQQGYNILLVDQRAHGSSEGETVSMGILERYDCLRWIAYAVNRFAEKDIILMGVSMGASTVLMTSGHPLPSQIKGIIADCGYSDVREIMTKISCRVKLPFHLKMPGELAYQLTKIGAFLFGRFNPEDTSPKTAVQKCELPMLIIHGEKDRLVPVYMAHDNFSGCNENSELFLVPEADHIMSYYVDTEGYTKRVTAFIEKCLNMKE